MKSKLVYGWIGGLLLSVILVMIVMNLKSDYKVIVEVQPSEIPKEQKLAITQYIPLVKDHQWIYRINDNSADQLLVSVDFVNNNIIQLRFDSEYKDIVKVYTFEDDGFYEVATIKDVSYKVNYTTTRQYKKPILKLPLEEGRTWRLTPTEQVTIESVDYKYPTETGEIKAIKVRYELDEHSVNVYYGEKLGVLEVEYEAEQNPQSLHLVKMQPGSMIQELVDVYYVNEQEMVLDKVIQEVKIRTNEEPKHFLTDLLKITLSENHLQTLDTATVINNVYYDEDVETVYIDLNESYKKQDYDLKEQKLVELSIINTVGSYYNAKYAKLTVEGKNYEVQDRYYDKEKGLEVGRY